MENEVKTDCPKVDDEHYTTRLQKERDNRNLLPTDDQLDQYVDNLCDTFPVLHVEETLRNFEADGKSSSCISSENSPATSISTGEKLTPKNENHKRFLVKRSSVSPKEYFKDKLKTGNEMKSFSNNNLNLAIIQCAGSLESLVQKRKSLELLVQMHRKVLNINYNFSYTPRLPDSPTRVDRLLFDVNQERCRILGLISALEDTVNSFSSKHTKDDLRKLLVTYAQAITDVIKERQCEINSDVISDHNSGILRLVKLINEVHRMNRFIHSALWCIEVKEQMGLVMLRRNFQKVPKSFEGKKETKMIPQKWHSVKLMPEKQSISPHLSRATIATDLQYHKGRILHQHQTSTTLNSSALSQANKVTPSLSHCQQQRDETFQRFL